MIASTYPILKDLVLVGGGHAHVTVIKQFGMRPVDGLRLTLISPDANAPYSGMLPGLIAGHYSHEDAHIDLQRLCRFAGADFVCAEVAGLDRAAKHVRFDDRPPIEYDILSINAGSTPDPDAVPGAMGRVIPVKPVAEFLLAWDAVKASVLDDPKKRIGVVGAGAGGVELALATQFAISTLLRENGVSASPSFHVVTSGDDILDTHNSRVRSRFRKLLNERGVDVATGFRVERVDEQGVWSGDKHIALDEIFWVTGAAPPKWLATSGLDVNERGFLRIGETLRSTNDVSVFAAGDNSGIENHPRPKSGVFAVRQGPPLELNLRKALLGKPLTPYRPQKAFLSLISTGDKNAIASWMGLTAHGQWVWRMKDRIDRAFMDTFNILPEMTGAPRAAANRIPLGEVEEQALGNLDMRCGGCAAKVGAQSLAGALSGLPIARRDDVIIGLGSPDDAAVSRVPNGMVTVQSIDAFRSMVNDPYVLGMIAANHSLGDLFAMGAAPQTALSVIGMPLGLPAKTAAVVHQILQGAVRVLNEAGCELTGGHTSESGELTVGFAVTGLAAEERLTRKSGMKAGDRLILTKPIGTGVIFAGDMRAKARGHWVAAAIRSALLSNARAADILQSHGLTACTDVTGFGLGGHAMEMATASDKRIELVLRSVPTLPGAHELLNAGITSTLHTQNAHASTAIAVPPGIVTSDSYPLLFDPQTAGGLLASIPPEHASDALKALIAAGYGDATLIGTVHDRDAPTAPLIKIA